MFHPFTQPWHTHSTIFHFHPFLSQLTVVSVLTNCQNSCRLSQQFLFVPPPPSVSCHLWVFCCFAVCTACFPNLVSPQIISAWLLSKLIILLICIYFSKTSTQLVLHLFRLLFCHDIIIFPSSYWTMWISLFCQTCTILSYKRYAVINSSDKVFISDFISQNIINVLSNEN